MLSSHFLLVLATFFSVAATKPTSPIVSLDYGTFQGAYDGNLTKFLGVPFSRPTGRFELAQDPTPLNGLQNATAFGPACPQQALSPFPLPASRNYSSISEACLTLDVFAPAAAHPGSKLPILVWLFAGMLFRGVAPHESDAFLLAGGFETGNSAGVDVRGTVERSMLLGEPVIIVTPNYRVSAFGFLAGKERDQILALEWVQKHIATFGGDPRRVVLGGASAGSTSTSLHLLSTQSSLFRGVFMVSGSPMPSPTVADGQPIYDELVEANNCTQASDTLECLRNVPFDDFLATVNKTPDYLSYRSLALVWRPRVDGDIVLRNLIDSVVQGEFAKIPILAGDGSPFGTGLANQVTPEFKRVAAFEGDVVFNGLRRLLVQHASLTQNTWSWLNKRGKSTPELGAFHTSDLALFFPANSTVPADHVAVDALSTVRYSVNFLNTLDPNQSAAPTRHGSNSSVFWPKWQTPSAEGSTSLLTFSDPAVVNVTADNFRAEQIQFLVDLHVDGVSSVGL
ncbi:Alpha/Beta hydrolase protein [Mycena epipterygia]|nr:Alpha/Beta hydrolase protein [Mycena epipterygia]